MRQGETWRRTTAYLGYRLIAWLGRTLPERWGHRLYTWAGRLAAWALPDVRGRVAANQSRVLGRAIEDPLVHTATRQAFERYARYWFDTFHMMDWADDEVLRRFVVDGEHHMQAALEKGNGVIFALPHMGNWDVAGRWVSARGHRLVSVAERLEPPRLYELFLKHRRAMNLDIIGLDDANVGRQLVAALRANRVVCLVADRDLTGRGVEVEMFGAGRRLPAGPALLSLSTGAPLIVTSVVEMAGGWRCVMNRPIEVERTGDRSTDVVAVTERLAREFEQAISASPPDWHLFQPGWHA